jgi:hypothetical protein
MTNDVTTLIFTRPNFQKLSDYVFNLNLLVR